MLETMDSKQNGVPSLSETNATASPRQAGVGLGSGLFTLHHSRVAAKAKKNEARERKPKEGGGKKKEKKKEKKKKSKEKKKKALQNGMFGWGSKPPPPSTQQVMRAEQRRIGTSQRELEREINSLRRQEQDLMVTIKREAKKPNCDQAVMRARARDVAKIRGQIDKLQKANATLSTVKTQTTMAASTATIASAMGTASHAMRTAAGAVSVEEIQRSAMEMQRQQQMFEVTDEMLEDMFADGIDEDEEDDILAQVSDELGLEFGTKLPAPRADALPSAAPAVRTPESDAAIDDMIAKLLAS